MKVFHRADKSLGVELSVHFQNLVLDQLRLEGIIAEIAKCAYEIDDQSGLVFPANVVRVHHGVKCPAVNRSQGQGSDGPELEARFHNIFL